MKTWSVVAFATFALGICSEARANSFLEVSPSMVELTVLPGETRKGKITVRNPGDTEVLVSVDSRDGWKEQSGRSSLPPSLWLTLKIPKKLVLKPKSEKSISYKVKMPMDFSGETMAFVFFSGPSSGGGKALGIQLRQGIPIYVGVKGTEKTEVRLASFSPALNPKKELEIAFSVLAEGNVHIRPHGVIHLKSDVGAPVSSIDMDYGQPLFPGRANTFYARSKTTGWRPGRYEAEVVLSYGENYGVVQQFQDTRVFSITPDQRVVVEETKDVPPEAGRAP